MADAAKAAGNAVTGAANAVTGTIKSGVDLAMKNKAVTAVIAFGIAATMMAPPLAAGAGVAANVSNVVSNGIPAAVKGAAASTGHLLNSIANG